MTGTAATIASVLMIAGFLLAAGGLYLIVARSERSKGLLMIVAALVMFANVLIWTL